jgi:hypothetical protein
MRVAVLLLCLFVTACQAGPGTTSTDERPRSRDTYGGRCSPYASNCW